MDKLDFDGQTFVAFQRHRACNDDLRARFGLPGLASCLQASKELESLSGDLVLIPENGPYLKRVGNCVIAVGFEIAATIAWTVFNKIVTSLLEFCLEFSLTKRMGGMGVSRFVLAGKRQKEVYHHFIPVQYTPLIRGRDA